MSFTYTIADDNTVSVFAEGHDEPSLVQPTAPDGKPFKDAKAAEVWAKGYLAHIAEAIPAGIAELEAQIAQAQEAEAAQAEPAPTE